MADENQKAGKPQVQAQPQVEVQQQAQQAQQQAAQPAVQPAAQPAAQVEETDDQARRYDASGRELLAWEVAPKTNEGDEGQPEN